MIAVRLAQIYKESGLGKPFNFIVLLCVVYQNNHKDFAHLFLYVLFTCLRLDLSNGRGKTTGRNFEQRSPNGTVIL